MEPGMLTLLHIDASLDDAASVTRRLSARFVERWHRANPTARVLRRDLAVHPAHALSADFVRVIKRGGHPADAREAAAWEASAALSAEFLVAQRYAVGLPMHILTVPSNFKAYLEQIFHRGRVFQVTAQGPQGLLGGRRFVFFCAKGADYRPGAPLARFDMLTPYLRALLGFCGVREDDIAFVETNDALAGGGVAARDLDAAERWVERFAATW
jgi:FMN-dependent NADH-azoreductase